MRVAVLAVALLLFLPWSVGCDDEDEQEHEQDDATVPCSGNSGEQIYSDYCSVCHGAELEGGPSYPGLAGDGLKASWKARVRDGTEGRFGADSKMRAFGEQELSSADLDSVLDYVVDGEPAGHGLYVGACSMCHGVSLDGVVGDDGEVLGPPIGGEGLRAHWHQITAEGVAPGVSAETMPVYPLCEADVAAVVGYLADLVGPDEPLCATGNDGCLACGADPSGETLYLQLCLGCHGQGTDGRRARDKNIPGLLGEGLANWWRIAVREGSEDRIAANSKMRPYPSTEIPDRDLDLVLDYLVAGVAAGQPLYIGRCAMCHGVALDGVSIGGKSFGPALAGSALLARWGASTRAGPPSRRNEWPLWNDMFAFPLCDSELAALTDYMGSGMASSPGCAAQTGEELYGTYCADCHGATAVEGRPTDGVPGLKGDGRKAWFRKLTREGSVGRDGEDSLMESIPAEDVDDLALDALLDYVVTLAQSGAEPDPEVSRLLVHRCTCHGASLQGSNAGPAISGAGLRERWSTIIENGPHLLVGGAPRLVEVGGEERPSMPAFPLCEDEILRIAEFLVPL